MDWTFDSLYKANYLFTGQLLESCVADNLVVSRSEDTGTGSTEGSAPSIRLSKRAGRADVTADGDHQVTGNSAMPRKNGWGW
jgi:hypothetical protein